MSHVNKVTGHASQHYLVPVPSRDKLGGLRQMADVCANPSSSCQVNVSSGTGLPGYSRTKGC